MLQRTRGRPRRIGVVFLCARAHPLPRHGVGRAVLGRRRPAPHDERLRVVPPFRSRELRAKLRIGSNFPIPGYYAETNGAYFVTDVRNTARLPVYGRLDLRANRAFNWSRRRLTLFAEVINVLNRDNVRFQPPGVNVTTRTVSNPFEFDVADRAVARDSDRVLVGAREPPLQVAGVVRGILAGLWRSRCWHSQEISARACGRM